MYNGYVLVLGGKCDMGLTFWSGVCLEVRGGGRPR